MEGASHTINDAKIAEITYLINNALEIDTILSKRSREQRKELLEKIRDAEFLLITRFSKSLDIHLYSLEEIEEYEYLKKINSLTEDDLFFTALQAHRGLPCPRSLTFREDPNAAERDRAICKLVEKSKQELAAQWSYIIENSENTEIIHDHIIDEYVDVTKKKILNRSICIYNRVFAIVSAKDQN